MAHDKWLSELSRDDLVTTAARHALHERLTTVAHYLPLAAEHAGDDIEHVHQLRVSSRRARTAVQLFQDLIPSKSLRWLQKRLRQLRKAANDARDLDVLLERLLTQRVEVDDSGLVELVMEIVDRRRVAQRPLIEVFMEQDLSSFETQVRRVCKAVRWPSKAGQEPRFGAAAKSSLAPLVDQFFAAAADDLSVPEKLHQMRIEGKQVRYALELLSSAFDESVRNEVYPVFEEAQKKLGVINDYATAKDLYADWIPHAGPKSKELLARLAAHEDGELEKTSRAFHRWWTPKRLTAMKQLFDQLLERKNVPDDDSHAAIQSNGNSHSGVGSDSEVGNGTVKSTQRKTRKPRS